MRGNAAVNLVNMLCAKHAAYLKVSAAFNVTCEQRMLPTLQWQALYRTAEPIWLRQAYRT